MVIVTKTRIYHGGFNLYAVVENYFSDLEKRREINYLLDIEKKECVEIEEDLGIFGMQ